MRVALFSPLPPIRSGIADYTRDLVAALTGDMEIECSSPPPTKWTSRVKRKRRPDTPPRTTFPGVTTARRTT